jgi:hypothetical protein
MPCFQQPPEIAELLGIQNAGRLVHRLVHSFPKLQYVAMNSDLRFMLTFDIDYKHLSNLSLDPSFALI